MTAAKYLVLASSFLLFLCLGVNYSWSIIAQELRAHHGFSMAVSQSVFSIYQFVFTLAFLLGGRLLTRLGTTKTGIIGTVFFGTGFLLAGFLPLTPACLILSIGIISGAGLGIAYGCPIYAAQKAFSAQKALATGVTVAGFALSAVCFAFIAEFLLGRGWSLAEIFKLYGVIFLAVGWFASLGLSVPAGRTKSEFPEKIRLLSVFNSKAYWMMFLPMFCGLFAGMLVISNLKTIGLRWGMTVYVAAIGVSVMSFFNAFGRVGWGYVAQKWREETAIRLSLLIQATALILAAFFIDTPALFFIFSAIAGFNYGANMVLYASLVSRIFGVELFGKVYPLVFLCNSLAGMIAPITGGRIYDVTGSYFWAVVLAGIICFAGLAVFEVLREKPSIKREQSLEK
jgi:OFA family oxalate/formate antiporter-like MFS transporter